MQIAIRATVLAVAVLTSAPPLAAGCRHLQGRQRRLDEGNPGTDGTGQLHATSASADGSLAGKAAEPPAEARQRATGSG